MKIRNRLIIATAALVTACGCMTIDQTPLALQTGRYGHAAVTDREHLFVIGGSSSEGYMNDIEAIDPYFGHIGVWDKNLIPRRYHGAVLTGADIYIMGGVNRDGKVAEVEIFNLDSGDVTYGPPLPTPRRMAKVVLLNERIYVVGGEADKSDASRERTGLMEVYDIASKTWKTAAPMPTPRECSVTVADGKIYAIGGFAGGKEGLRAMEVYDPDEDAWTSLKDLPFILSANSAVSTKKYIYTFGDYKQLDRVCRYTIKTDTWEILETDYQPSRHNAAVRVGGKAIVLGGNVASSDSYLDLVQTFQLKELK